PAFPTRRISPVSSGTSSASRPPNGGGETWCDISAPPRGFTSKRPKTNNGSQNRPITRSKLDVTSQVNGPASGRDVRGHIDDGTNCLSHPVGRRRGKRRADSVHARLGPKPKRGATEPGRGQRR